MLEHRRAAGGGGRIRSSELERESLITWIRPPPTLEAQITQIRGSGLFPYMLGLCEIPQIVNCTVSQISNAYYNSTGSD